MYEWVFVHCMILFRIGECFCLGVPLFWQGHAGRNALIVCFLEAWHSCAVAFCSHATSCFAGR